MSSPLPFGLSQPPADHPQKPAGISVCMIVKNEERFLEQCLRSVADVADEIIITDTGSTDRTIEIAKSFGATVIERPWRNDFGWARNQSLELATKRWILAMDADEELTPESKASLLTLKTVPAYREAIWVRFLNRSDDYGGTGVMSHALIRIFPNDPLIRYRGLIHEYPTYNNDPNGLQGAMASVEIIHHGYMSDVVETREKGARNLALVKAATEKEPGDAFHWFNLGTTAFLVNDYELARDSLEKMREVNAGAKRGFMPNGLAVLAEVYCDKLNEPEKGEEVCRDSLRVSPRYANAHFQLGKALVAQKRYDEAREAYQAAIADGEFAHLQFVVDDQVYRWKSHSEIGSSFVMQGDDVSATQWFRKGLENAPGVEPLQINLARSLERQTLLVEAGELYRAAFQTHRSGASTVEYVNFLLRRGEGLAALAIIDESHAAIDDLMASQLLFAGWQIATKHGLANPIRYLERAAERAPWSAEFLNPLEKAYRENGAAAALAALLEREAASTPRNPADYLRRSYHALGSGRFEEALAFTKAGLEDAPHDAHLHYNAALALGNLDRRTESEVHLRQISASDADVYPSAELLLAAGARDRGDLDEALVAVARLLVAQPRNRDGLALRASLLEARGDIVGAEETLQTLFSLDRRRGAVELAGLLMRAGRYAEAAQVADRALTTLDYSIIIPVFNKASLTRQCLESLRPTLEGAGNGEVIVIDNASSDETPDMLKEFPWVRVIRNDVNLGFAGANNQGARAANGTYLVLLNNDTMPLSGWLASMLEVAKEPNVGVVGARLLYANDTVQHAGVVVCGVLFSRQALVPFHHNLNVPADDEHAGRIRDYQVVTGACIVTPSELYAELGGLDESFWNGYEDVDYCFKVRERGLRVVSDGEAALYHFESQSGAQRFRKSLWNAEFLIRRWGGRLAFDAVTAMLERGMTRHIARASRGRGDVMALPFPPTIVIVHGTVAKDARETFEARLRASMVPITSIVWADGDDAFERAQEALRVRGFRYAAFVDARTLVENGWLDELVRQLETSTTTAAATYSPDAPLGENVRVFAPDARCTLFQLKRFPAHIRLQRHDSWDGIVADFALQALPLGLGTRGVGRRIAAVPPLARDAAFEREHGRELATIHLDDPQAIEAALVCAPRKRSLVSIVTLSWNAPEFTRKALESIRAHTSEPYEVIVVDNGSGAETVEMLRAIDDPHVRVVYNESNRGYAGGNNDGIAAARGDYIILLNNDVIVTEGWVDGLLWPFSKLGNLGVSAPRSNKVVGHQQVHDALYNDEAGLEATARDRRERLRHRGYITDRAIGLCLCIDRRVLSEIGGMDESYGVGNFEDDDFCIRVRSAGYQIYICDDVFIHHFGSQSFKANNVDYMATMRANWNIFARKWGYPTDYPTDGYDPRTAIYRGFDRVAHFCGVTGVAMRYDIAADSLRFDGNPRAKASIVRAENLAYARFETTISHRVEGLMDLIFETPDAMAIVPWIALDGIMLMEREVSIMVWPSWMRWLDADVCDAIEDRIEPWLRSRVVARLENGAGERFFDASPAMQERISYARASQWLGVTPASDVLRSIAAHRYAWRFAGGADAVVCGAGAANGGALLARRAASVTARLEDQRAVDAARWWFGVDCFAAQAPAANRNYGLYVGPRSAAVDAATRIYLDGDALPGELRVPIAQPLPLAIMVSFDVDDAPEVGAFSVLTSERPGRPSVFGDVSAVGGSTGRVALVVREDCERAADADTDAVAVLASRLASEGFIPHIVTPSHFDGSNYDLIHVFGFRYAASILRQLEIAANRGVPIAITPYADDPVDEHRVQGHNMMSLLVASFDETLRLEYLDALSHRKVNTGEFVPEADRESISRLFELAGVVFTTSSREEGHIRATFGYSGAVARVAAYAEALRPTADVAALVGTDDYILMRGPVDWRSNQYLVARAAASVGLPLVVTGVVTDALCYLKVAEVLGDAGIWLPAATLSAAQERGLVSRARVVADISWSGHGLHRLATAAASSCALVASESGYAIDVLGDAVVPADPRSIASISAALLLAWGQSNERAEALAAAVAATCDPFAALVSTVGGYQAAAASLVRS